MPNNPRKHSAFATVLLIAVLFVAKPIDAQNQSPAPGALTAAQCQMLLPGLQAIAKAGETQTLTPVQIQLMVQCLGSQSPANPTTSLPGAQFQNLLPSLPSQSQPNPQGAIQASSTSLPPAGPNAAPPLGPKKAGVIRIGIVQPKAQMGQGNSGANVAEPIRGLISQYLNGPFQEIVPLSAMLPSQIDAEAGAKECDYVLYSAISQKMGSGGATSFLKKAVPMTSVIPMVGVAGGVSGAVAGATAATALAGASSVASTVKAKSEVTFEYKLMIPGNPTPALANTEKGRAKEDGEDIISP